MDAVFNAKEECFGCTLCTYVCPVSSITMEADSEGFMYPIIDQSLCIDCNACVDICPHNVNYKTHKESDFYVAIHKSEDVLMESTSGGAFTAISDVILENGGIVYGVDFNEQLNVVHKRGETVADRDRMRFSKYVQSDLSDIFSQIENDLNTGRTVYFTGTPCQCAGLRGFTNGKTFAGKLLLTDVICYGVPSPLIWDDYKKYLAEISNKTVNLIRFRSKKLGWSRDNSNKLFEFRVDGETEFRHDDKFNFLFLGKQLIMRPSCSACPYCDDKRTTDITIADYWGIEKYAPDWFDKRGVSVIMVNTPEGEKLFQKAMVDMKHEKRPPAESMSEQGRLGEPVPPGKNRYRFWQNYYEHGFKYSLNIELDEEK